MKAIFNFRSIGRNILAIVAGALLISGCAPQNAISPLKDRAAGLKALGLISTEDPNWRCPYVPNLTLHNDIGRDGSVDMRGDGNFTVCKSRDDNDNQTFNIAGYTKSLSICVYPIWTTKDRTKLVPLENPQCFNVGNQSITVRFNTTQTNYMAIVDTAYAQQMNACLSGPAACPSHSEGPIE